MTTSPTPSELAAIAASLAHGTAIDASTAKSFAGQALLLWQACQEATREPNLTEQCVSANAALRAILPKPKRFPITLDELIAHAFEGKRRCAREGLFSEYLDRFIRSRHLRSDAPVTPRERTEEMKHWTRQVFAESQYLHHTKQIRDWLAQRNAVVASAKASKAASAKATKLAEAEIAEAEIAEAEIAERKAKAPGRRMVTK